MNRVKRVYAPALAAIAALILASGCSLGSHTSQPAKAADAQAMLANNPTTHAPDASAAAPAAVRTSGPAPGHVTAGMSGDGYRLCLKPGGTADGFNTYALAAKQQNLEVFVRRGPHGREIQTPSFPHWIRIDMGVTPDVGSIYIETKTGWHRDNSVMPTTDPAYNDATYGAVVGSWEGLWRQQIATARGCTR